MPIKVFLSHQKADSTTAGLIAYRLKTHHGIDSYLDLIDPYLGKGGEGLASHIRIEMGKCTQLLAVVSYSTRESQWVPWEIGVATEKDFPLATYADFSSVVPEFLREWPYLRSMTDVDQYAASSKAAENMYTLKKRSMLSEEYSQRSASETFFSDIRTRLRQPR